MYFKRINETTINCVITPEDLSNNGIKLDDLFERKKEALDYLKSVIMKAAKEENFTLSGEYTSMRVTVLPDHSVSLTLSENKSRIKINDLRGLPVDAGELKSDKPVISGDKEVYGFVFDIMDDVINCCKALVSVGGDKICTSSLYLDEEYYAYYLFLECKGNDFSQFEKTVLSLNEYGDFFNEGPSAIAFIREHGKCIVKDKAASVLAEL